MKNFAMKSASSPSNVRSAQWLLFVVLMSTLAACTARKPSCSAYQSMDLVGQEGTTEAAPAAGLD